MLIFEVLFFTFGMTWAVLHETFTEHGIKALLWVTPFALAFVLTVLMFVDIFTPIGIIRMLK